MAQSIHEGDLFVNGALNAASMSLPANAVQDTTVVAAANLAASKLEHQYEITYSQEVTTDAADEQRVVHVVKGATGSVVALRAGAVTVAGATTTVTVDLLKNGTTMLSAVATLNDTQAAYELVSGTLSTTALVAGDVLTIKFDLTGTNEPKGCFAQVIVREKAQ